MSLLIIECNEIHLNMNIFDFKLTDEEMNQIRKIDQKKKYFDVTLEEMEKLFSQIPAPAD